MSGENGATHVRVCVHVQPETALTVKAFDSFVTLDVGELPGAVSLFLRDEDDVNRLAAAVGEARAKLVGALTRAKQEAAGQPELPVAC
jgi:hypothetical protein